MFLLLFWCSLSLSLYLYLFVLDVLLVRSMVCLVDARVHVQTVHVQTSTQTLDRQIDRWIDVASLRRLCMHTCRQGITMGTKGIS